MSPSLWRSPTMWRTVVAKNSAGRAVGGVLGIDHLAIVHGQAAHGVHAQRSRARCKGAMLILTEVLIAEEQHLVGGQRVPDLRKGLVGERLAKVDAG